jgi:hypothetical protein
VKRSTEDKRSPDAKPERPVSLPDVPQPKKRPGGSRRPYPVDDPGISSPDRPGADPDYLPGVPVETPDSLPRL